MFHNKAVSLFASLCLLQTTLSRSAGGSSAQNILTETLSKHQGYRTTGGDNNGAFCSRNSACASGCCDWGRGIPGLGHCSDSSGCWWLTATDDETPPKAPESEKCKHELDFGPPTAYKLKIGNTFLAKVGSRISPDPYGEGDVFYSSAKGPGIGLWVKEADTNQYLNQYAQFTSSQPGAATWNVSVSQYGRKLSLIDEYTQGVLTKDLQQSRTPLVIEREDSDRAATISFTRYVPPVWTVDSGPTRAVVLEELIEKMCKPDDMDCAETLYEYLRPGNVEKFMSCT